jgi:hypothetical protein
MAAIRRDRHDTGLRPDRENLVAPSIRTPPRSRSSKSARIPEPHYRLYALFTSERRLFHNIVRSCNTYMDVPGFCAHPGYSPAGRLGSFDGAALLKAY